MKRVLTGGGVGVENHRSKTKHPFAAAAPRPSQRLLREACEADLPASNVLLKIASVSVSKRVFSSQSQSCWFGVSFFSFLTNNAESGSPQVLPHNYARFTNSLRIKRQCRFLSLSETGCEVEAGFPEPLHHLTRNHCANLVRRVLDKKYLIAACTTAGVIPLSVGALM